MKSNRIVVLLMWCLLVGVVFLSAAGADQTVVVTQNDIGVSWFPADTRAGGTVSFVDGLGSPPMGYGSLQMTTDSSIQGSSKAKAQFFNYGYIGTKLSDITAISYWAYRDGTSTNSLAQTISLNIEVDYAGDGTTYTVLVFEPVYNPAQGSMQVNAWQKWDAIFSGNAKWWSSRPLPGNPGVCAFDCFVPWSTILQKYPNAKIRGGFGFNVGSGWNGKFIGTADALTIGVAGAKTTYDFERKPAPMEAKERVLDALLDLLPTGDPKTDHRVDKAVGDIEKSLSAELWIDDSHLADKGKKAFEEEKQAVNELQKLVKDGCPCSPDVTAAILGLVSADEDLAQIEIDAAVTAGGDAKYLEKALKNMDDAAYDLAKGDYDKAIEEYKKAWEYARKAYNKAVED